MNKNNNNLPLEQDNPLFHDTWKLLKNYRDAVWNLELAVQQVRNTFEVEFGSSIEDFLNSIYLAGADVGGSKLESYAKSIERSKKSFSFLTLPLIFSAVSTSMGNNITGFCITAIFLLSSCRIRMR